MEPAKGSAVLLAKYFHILHLCVSFGLVIAVVHNQLVNNARFDQLEHQVTLQSESSREGDKTSSPSLKVHHSIMKRSAVVSSQQSNKMNSTTLANENSSRRKKVDPEKKKDVLMCLDMLRIFVKNDTTKAIRKLNVCDKLRGPPGKQGPRGLRGKKGKRGTKGIPGQKGRTGNKGSMGKHGPPGPRGEKGFSGNVTVIGLKGDMGRKGDQGNKGDQGIKGQQGTKGSKGESGGPKGDPGQPGLKGDIGPRGCTGDSFAAPQFYSSPRNLVFTEGNRATLLCNATANPYSHIMWYRDNEKINTVGRYSVKENVTVPSVLHSNNMTCEIKRHAFTQSSLGIEQSRGNDTGTYFCEARNVMGVLRYQIKLLIQVYVQFTMFPSNITLVEKDNVRLSCRASGVPSPLITWQRKDGKPMPNVYRVVLGDLHITGITKHDDGVYECVASNVLGSKTTEAVITVNVFPEISHFKEQTTTINESQSLHLPCSVTGFPPPKINWHKVNDSLPDGRYEYNNQRLTVSNAKYADGGEYVCTANNTLGTISKRTTVVVQVAPKILQKPGAVEYGYRGYDKTLFVKVFALPQASFQWNKNGKSIRTMEHSAGNLTLKNVQYEDSGLYDVIAKNALGQVRVAIFLIIKDPGITAKSNCGFTDMNSDNGRFTSPNYPGQYNVNENCTWTLKSTPVTSRITLSFQAFDIETFCDYLKVYDGNSSSSPLLGVFNGTLLPPIIISSSNKLLITFTSDNLVKKTGFTAKYQMASKSSLPTKHIAKPKSDPMCRDGWTLVARFSNSDNMNWMMTEGSWWYDVTTTQGDPTSASVNQDMIAPAFWTTKGREIKITRTDDPTHTALLVTNSNCLGGQTLRAKLASYGNFRNGVVWASEQCLGSCSVTYGGAYSSTVGFSMAECDGSIQARNKIGFWCDYDSGDGAVMMIGGGGSGCSRADHGLGITEEYEAKFGLEKGCDFGNHHPCGSPSYALNVWIK